MNPFKLFLIALLAVVTAVAVTAVAAVISTNREVSQAQATLDPFYDSPDPLGVGAPGQIIRSEPLTPAVSLKNANAWRVLYRTERPDGTPRVSGAMLFIPTTPAPKVGRNVVSWAHPTVGMGPQCAPSRSSNPLMLMDWLQGMLDQGWIVTATDYAGLGTAGIEAYLIGQDEAIDTVNAVRMARNFPGAQASSKYGVFGHSQGGHTAMWAGAVGPKYAPELSLVGVAGAAPASNLGELVNELWNGPSQWVIGAEVLISYPNSYPNLNAEQIATEDGLAGYKQLANDCIIAGGLASKAKLATGKTIFSQNPMSNPAWGAALTAQTAKPLPASMPVLVVESINDGVVLPNTIASMQKQWCAAGSTIQVDWLGPLRGNVGTPSASTHAYEGAVGGSLATSWLAQRFENKAAPNNCDTVPLVPTTPSE